MNILSAIADVAALLQPLIVSVSAVIGTVVAVVGLQTWRKQLKGRTEYDLARRFLRAALELRDAIHDVRRPIMLGGEIHAAAKEAGIEIDPRSLDQDEAVAAARGRRWMGVQEATSALRVEELEAEVLWGPEVAGCTEALHQAIRSVWVAEMEYNDLKGERPRTEEDRERIPKLRRIMYGSGIEGDETAQAIKEGVQAIEAVVRPHLDPGSASSSTGQRIQGLLPSRFRRLKA